VRTMLSMPDRGPSSFAKYAVTVRARTNAHISKSRYGAPGLLLLSCDMSRLLNEITHAYPALAVELSSLSADEVSDSRLMAELASHVVDLFEAGRAEDVRPAFELAEHLITAGTDAERQAAIVGFLETVQNVASHRRCGPVFFERFLGPMSQRAWAELIHVWRDKTSLAEVVASETGTTLRPPRWQFWKRRNRRIPSELLNEVQNPELRKIIEQMTRE
jgi:hypothetical protein